MFNGFSSQSHGSFTEPRNDTKIKDYTVKKEYKKLIMDFDVKADKGKITVVILDPNGIVYFNNTIIRKDEYTEKITVKDPMPGIWKVKTIFEEAIGQYTYKVSGK
ncbi:hypothetical protein [Sporosalibacterium faouarense]|uniref:hypothetical protein n=1 Tax=Sporosalibacterium faouarense TaxID=516123 RepID=UPI00192CD429|nr:hypothetical protein [Sporosalibacterium faouarense]